jgi:hypothetical protein
VSKVIEMLSAVDVTVGKGVEFSGSSEVTEDIDSVNSVTNEYDVDGGSFVDVKLEIPSEELLLVVIKIVLLGMGVE